MHQATDKSDRLVLLDRELGEYDLTREKMDRLNALLLTRGELIGDLAKIAEVWPTAELVNLLQQSVESGTAMTQKLADFRRKLGNEHQKLELLAPCEMALDQDVADDIARDSG